MKLPCKHIFTMYKHANLNLFEERLYKDGPVITIETAIGNF